MCPPADAIEQNTCTGCSRDGAEEKAVRTMLSSAGQDGSDGVAATHGGVRSHKTGHLQVALSLWGLPCTTPNETGVRPEVMQRLEKPLQDDAHAKPTRDLVSQLVAVPRRMGRGPKGAFRSHVGSKLLFDVLSFDKPRKVMATAGQREKRVQLQQKQLQDEAHGQALFHPFVFPEIAPSSAGAGPRGAFRTHVGSKKLFDALSLENTCRVPTAETLRKRRMLCWQKQLDAEAHV